MKAEIRRSEEGGKRGERERERERERDGKKRKMERERSDGVEACKGSAEETFEGRGEGGRRRRGQGEKTGGYEIKRVKKLNNRKRE